MYPEFPTLLLPYLDLAGTAVFATSGALAAARARQTPLTFAFFAVVTGIGGNTLSELLMGVPVAWVHHPTNIVVCLVVALVTWTTPLAWWPIARSTGSMRLASQPMARWEPQAP
jgi:uncharacterized membrane protein YeiH